MKFNFDKIRKSNSVLTILSAYTLAVTIAFALAMAVVHISPWFLAALPLAALARVLYVTYEPSKD
jgi:hypothetical protein